MERSGTDQSRAACGWARKTDLVQATPSRWAAEARGAGRQAKRPALVERYVYATVRQRDTATARPLNCTCRSWTLGQEGASEGRSCTQQRLKWRQGLRKPTLLVTEAPQSGLHIAQRPPLAVSLLSQASASNLRPCAKGQQLQQVSGEQTLHPLGLSNDKACSPQEGGCPTCKP